MKIVTCNGCFDGLHPGHLFFLGFCRGQGDKLVVGINDDTYIREKKNRDPQYSQYQRMEALYALGFVHDIHIFSDDNPNVFIEDVNPDIHCTGEEYRCGCPEMNVCNRLSIELNFVPRIKYWATSSLEEENVKFVDTYMERLIRKGN